MQAGENVRSREIAAGSAQSAGVEANMCVARMRKRLRAPPPRTVHIESLQWVDEQACGRSVAVATSALREQLLQGCAVVAQALREHPDARVVNGGTRPGRLSVGQQRLRCRFGDAK